MTHFELFDIPLSFFPDQKLIRSKFYALSRLYHPDLQGEADENKQGELLQKSGELNAAYKTLGSFNTLVPYVLRLKGELNDEEKAAVSPQFLMEMMDVNESLMEAKMEEDQERLASIAFEVKEFQDDITNAWKNLCKEYDRKGDESLLATIKDYYLRNRYLERLQDQLGI